MALVSVWPDYGKNFAVVEAGQVISGKYKLLRLLGDGGMGSVYEAEHLGLGTHVAIKVLHSELTRRAGITERFLQEARVSAQIKSPHVVQVTDVDRTTDGVAYLVMELLQGEPLSSVIKRDRKLPVETACEYALQILQGLEAAHALGVIHRDLKPDNVFVTFQGGKPVLKLIDFGIAKLKRTQDGQTKNLTVAGMLMGTPEYMAPEQAYSADKVDVRADLYAVGVMLYEMLSGTTPVSGEDPRVLVLKVERGEVTPLVHAAPGIRPEIAGFVHRAMAPRPEVRFANASEMRIGLERVLSGKQGTAPIAAKPSAVPVPAALADTAQARDEIRTGTVMGAPVESALASPNMGSERPPGMGGGTVGAAPINAGPMGPPPQMNAPAYAPSPYEPTRPPEQAKGGGSGLVIGLAIVALLLGAGAVTTYVMSTQDTTPAVPPPTFTTAAPPTTTTPPPPTTPVTQPPPLTPATLTNTTPPQPPVKPPVKPDAGGGQAQQDAGGGQAQADAGGNQPGQTTIVTPFGTVQVPGPQPPWWPPGQPWPPVPPPPPQ